MSALGLPVEQEQTGWGQTAPPSCLLCVAPPDLPGAVSNQLAQWLGDLFFQKVKAPLCL